MHTSPIFIGCQSKSGTSLLRTIIGRHPNIFGGDGFETHWFSQEIIGGDWENNQTQRQKWLKDWYEINDQDYHMLKKTSTSGIDFFDRFMTFCTNREGKKRWLEKTPDNLYHYNLINQNWPDVKFIHGVREFKDIYSSWKANKLGSLKTLTVHDFVQKVRHSYQQIEHLLGRTTENYIETKYEDLVNEPRSAILRVLDFVDESYIDGMENYIGDSDEFSKVKEIMGVESNTSRSLQKPIFTSSVGQWSKILTKDEIVTIDESLGDLREKLGYK